MGFSDTTRRQALELKSNPVTPGEDLGSLRKWPVPSKLSSEQTTIFKMIEEGKFEAASQLRRGRLANRTLISVDAYACAIIYYGLKDMQQARDAAAYALKLSLNDKQLSKEAANAAERILQLAR